MPVKGYATTEGTAAYARRTRCAYGHFRTAQGLSLSSIGLGTYMGEVTPEADKGYFDAIACALTLGCNVFDTAIHYRCQRSERVIAAALDGVKREEVFVATKVGYLPADGEVPDDPTAYFEQEYVARGLVTQEAVADKHSMSPAFLEDQLERSRRNLNLETIDLLYLANPEAQLSPTRNTTRLFSLLRPAFKFMEAQVAAGKIRWYGAATWEGLRRQADAPDYLSLEAFPDLAKEAGGVNHHFRFIQLPLNLGMAEALLHKPQFINKRPTSVLTGAAQFGISVITSAALMRGQCAVRVPHTIRQAFRELKTDAAAAIQFARSCPGITTALVGMGKVAHVEENLRLASIPPMQKEKYLALFNPQ